MGKFQERSPAEASKNLSRPEPIKVIRSGDTRDRDWNAARNILEQALITAANAGTNASVNRDRYLGEETLPWQINSRSSQTQTAICGISILPGTPGSLPKDVKIGKSASNRVKNFLTFNVM